MMSFANKSKGFTLIEAVMVIAIVGILAAVSSAYIKTTLDLWNFLSFRNEIVNQARTGFLRMTREMRQIANNTTVYFANSTRFNFTDYNASNINYYLSGSNLMRNANVLISGLNNLTFTYYNNNSGVIASPKVSPEGTDIYRIGITMGISSGTQSKVLRTQVFPRNFGKKE
jgi:prepilin-type N-terminal cleavage/methylation domain-containing protein